MISDRATLSLVAEDVVTQRVVSNRLRRGLTRREINEQYVRILDQAVEYNPPAVASNIKGPHHCGTAQPSQTP